jgi:hypothetical protein
MSNLEYDTSSSFYDYYLRANSEEELINSLNLANISIYPSWNTNIDIIGSIEKNNGEIDNRYHANLRCRSPLTEIQKQHLPLLIPIPANPICKW